MVNSGLVVLFLISLCGLSTQNPSLVSGIINKGISDIKDTSDTVHKGISNVINSGANAVHTGTNNAVNSAQDAANKGTDLANSAKDTVSKVTNDLANSAKDTVSKITNDLANSTKDAISKGTELANSAKETISKGIKDSVNYLAEIGQNLCQNFQGLSSLMNKVKELINYIKEILGNINITNIIKKLLSKAQTCLIKNPINLKKEVIKNLTQCAVNPIDGIINILDEVVTLAKAGKSLLEKVQGATGCDDISCLIKNSSGLLSDITTLATHAVSTLSHSIKLLTTDLVQAHSCVDKAIVDGNLKMSEISTDLVKCFMN